MKQSENYRQTEMRRQRERQALPLQWNSPPQPEDQRRHQRPINPDGAGPEQINQEGAGRIAWPADGIALRRNDQRQRQPRAQNAQPEKTASTTPWRRDLRLFICPAQNSDCFPDDSDRSTEIRIMLTERDSAWRRLYRITNVIRISQGERRRAFLFDRAFPAGQSGQTRGSTTLPGVAQPNVGGDC